MRTWTCTCGAELFFHNTRCVVCGKDVGLCEACDQVHPFEPADVGAGISGAMICPSIRGDHLIRCGNGIRHAVCNRYFRARGVGKSSPTADPRLCGWCKLTTHRPSLDVPENFDRWRRLEAAKRRTLFTVAEIGLPVGAGEDELAMSFQFLDDSDGHVTTGHADGVITVDVREADSVHREATRVEFGEPHRTLVGHIRHELGHYYWQRLVFPDEARLEEYRDRFGDERTPTYADAQKVYYERGRVANWHGHFVSQYATMHSWEDFAESFNAYLDMRTVLGTAAHFKIRRALRRRESPAAARPKSTDSFETMIADYARVGIVANEFNRDLGLLDLVPEVFTTAVVEKLKFIHRLCDPKVRVPELTNG